MKKKIIIYTLILLISFISYIGYRAIKNHQQKTLCLQSIQNLPEFSFITLKNKTFCNKNLKPNTPIVINYFHPDCEHCQYEVSDILEHKKDFETTQMLMISPAKPEKIKQFEENYDLGQLSNLVLLYDTAFIFEKTFGTSSFPTILVYSNGHKLLQKFKGEIEAEKIIELLNQ